MALTFWQRLGRRVYTFVMYLLVPVIVWRLAWRGVSQRAYFRRWGERFGFFSARSGADGALWVHAVSVGEVAAAAPLIGRLRERYPGCPLVITTITPTGSARVSKLWGEHAFHVYLPYDLPAAIRRFLRRTRPKIAIVMETEIWPNLFLECDAAGIPIIIANARLSERSLVGYGPVRGLARMAVRCAHTVAAQSQMDADRLIALGARPQRVVVAGNMKYDLALPHGLLYKSASWRSSWGAERPVWIAASTHEMEEAAVLRAQQQVLARYPDALLLWAPRHPERFRAVEQHARDAGLIVTSRSVHGLPGRSSQCFIINTLGELLMFYATVDLAFVGGSLQPIGGHNVLEAAALGVPCLVGPHTFNFAEVTEHLIAGGAALRVASADALGEAVMQLIADADQRNRMAEAARDMVASERGAVERTLHLIEPVLVEYYTSSPSDLMPMPRD
ncbi:MAG: lipid IV(A) 3-deoxy-D-manno-octulosonic acid transferase [Xanthomonadales bacterium]|nr:lipid IV(A) 3-deoxy-D-manno-octulosonic acid transferase [Xanthomonadales bacterium]MDZ4115577.1 lipid IV(A) 3-deoxy-D-manno-octulosonic acid transferase [Xanthomonadaceae bacterium]MDZ4379475.1 lipid IV(A) 3-deoxy-D-manno-octulosonic acid transferase [Xanthomonadaceae bacterium]